MERLSGLKPCSLLLVWALPSQSPQTYDSHLFLKLSVSR